MSESDTATTAHAYGENQMERVRDDSPDDARLGHCDVEHQVSIEQAPGSGSDLPESMVASPAGLTASPTSIRSELLDNLAGPPNHCTHLPSGKMREMSVRDHRVPGAGDSNSDLQVAMAGLDLADISADRSDKKTHYGWSDWQNLASASQKRPGASVTSVVRPATSSPQLCEVVWSYYGPRGPGDRPSRKQLRGLKLDPSTRLVEISKVMTNNVHRIFYWEMTVENRTGTAFDTMRWDGTIPKGVQQPLLGELEKESKELTRMQEEEENAAIKARPFDAKVFDWTENPYGLVESSSDDTSGRVTFD